MVAAFLVSTSMVFLTLVVAESFATVASRVPKTDCAALSFFFRVSLVLCTVPYQSEDRVVLSLLAAYNSGCEVITMSVAAKEVV